MEQLEFQSLYINKEDLSDFASGPLLETLLAQPYVGFLDSGESSIQGFSWVGIEPEVIFS